MDTKLRKLTQENERMDEKSWSVFYTKLQNYCCFLSQSKWDGEDIAQEVMLKAMQHYKHSSQMSSALLNKMAYHQWVDTVRKRKRETTDACPQGKMETTNPFNLDQLMETVDRLMQCLTPKQAVVFTLKEAFRYQAGEIADLMKTSETAIKSTLHRAKKRLENEDASSIRPFWDEEERELLSHQLFSALVEQDPSILLKSIPFIRSLTSEAEIPKLIMKGPKPISSSYSTLCMAA